MNWDSVKNLSLVIGALTVIYTGLWSTGLAPITNSKAQQMINDAVKSESREIQRKLDEIDKRFRKVDEIDKRTAVQGEQVENTDDNVKQILEELRLLRTQINRRQ